MKESKKKNIITLVAGLFTGLINGFFGMGGGMVLVPALENIEDEKGKKIETDVAHATSVFAVMFLSAVSLGFYLFNGRVDFSLTLPYIISGALGAPLGAFFLKKTDPVWLKRIFGAVIVFAAIRMFMR
jgi:uncharacterized membrane protein YfcA